MGRLGLAFAVAAMLAVTSCGGSDAGEGRAFINFLQTRIVDKPGLHVPQLTQEERASFGDYADQYGIITDFNKAMDRSISPKLTTAMSAGAITSVEDLVTHRSQLQAARKVMQEMAGTLGGVLARADAAHAKLDQPADVKAVYDKAYERSVTQPAITFKSVVPVADKVLGQAIDLGTYIDAHRAAVQLSGSMIQTNDPAIQAAINARLQALQSSQQAMQSAQQKMQAIVYGNPS